MTQPEPSSIPTLTDVLVPGRPERAPAREAGVQPQPLQPSQPSHSPHDDAALPLLTDVLVPGGPVAAPASVPAAAPAAEADPEVVAVHPVPTPDVPAVEWPPAEAATARDADAPAEPGAAQQVVAQDAAMGAPLSSTLAADVPPADAARASARSPGRPAAEDALPEAVVPAADAPAAALTAEDAQHIAERLRNRLTAYLTGAGRDAIEARCREALHEHSAWLVGQITREVALALETEVMDWVRDAVDEEIARRRGTRSD
ncbi:TPA: DUF2486 family protein [Burkholderia multivorans]|uniref:DUF2486 family protein n=1 Tax=Burkholderia multivorans TaxID=87883 RepID=UPI000CFEFD3C|nr:DUF2486 family protein [Burkholderia multivorans]MBU9297495.1 DUF2486 family protein [Burkholderia multivorans]MBU9302962.1 DUF2486 family protein [Burkholderia multivorans]MBU9405186.1 DUF2486 family protein [Burkholderia multivorans]MBU9500950.1 DUF2486 family protein [Burkholderia multivorans]MBU9507122.1 DUF2486 family protein [Burkholderia multivorans]